MSRQLYVNLPVKDLKKSIAFFTNLGFKFNPEFTDENASCMIVSDSSFVMLLKQDYFKTFITKQLSDAKKNTEVLMCFSAVSRAEVDKLVATAVAGGGKIYNKPKDHGFMYQHGFEDLDSHIWEVVYMEPNPA